MVGIRGVTGWIGVNLAGAILSVSTSISPGRL